MNEGFARSAGTRRCIIALTAVFCALTVGPGCGRETFDLLDVAGNAGSAGSLPVSAGAAGDPDSFGGGGNGNETGGGAGKTGMNHGGAGLGGGAGSGQGGGGGNPAGCLAGETCGSVVCPPSVSFCERCDSLNDCEGNKDSPYCIASVGRCVQCRDPGKVAIDCALDEVCYPLTLRCAHHCQTSTECVDDESHPICDRQFGACVACTRDVDCHPFSGHPGYCALGGTCVECDQSNEDAPNAAAVQCPDDKPYCVGLRCQNKPH